MAFKINRIFVIWESILILLGIVLLYGGAEALIKGSRSLALHWGMPPLIVGLTVVSIATSSPELFVSIQGALAKQGDLVMGNIIGSNIANIGLILGISAFVRPITVHLQIFRFDLPVLIVLTLFVAVCGVGYHFSRGVGLFLIAMGILYTWILVRWAKAEEKGNRVDIPWSQGRAWLGVIGGVLLLVIGAESLLRGAVALAQTFHVSEALVGLTLVAVGTSLPELATSLVAARKGEGDILIGNVVGSNIYNLVCVLGFASLFQPLVLVTFGWAPFVVVILFSLALIPLMRSGFILQRWEGGCLLFAYFLYLLFEAKRSSLF